MTKPLRAIVLAKVKPGSERIVVNKLLEIKEVDCAYIILGDYDVFACITISENNAMTSTSVNKLYHIISSKIATIEHIQSLNVMISMGYLSKKRIPYQIEIPIPSTTRD